MKSRKIRRSILHLSVCMKTMMEEINKGLLGMADLIAQLDNQGSRFKELTHSMVDFSK
jgi:hypothetical protein